MDTCEFRCSRCGGVAGSVELVGTTDRPQLRRTSFTSVLTDDLGTARVAAVRLVIRSGDAAALYAIDEEYAPFFCPECGVSYCGAHWQRWDVFEGDWHDSVRGRCPEGHERQLED